MTTGFKIVLFTLLGVMVLGGMNGCSTYNTMVTMEEGVNSSWSQVENVYQRRMDLIPNLVEVVKGYANHEAQTLIGVIEARSKATQVTIDPSNLNTEQIQQFQVNQDGLSSALSKLMVVVESYPELKANQNFLELQSELEGTENRISVERKRYNETAQRYNTKIKKFPSNIWAKMFDFESKPYFEAQSGAENAPKVNF